MIKHVVTLSLAIILVHGIGSAQTLNIDLSKNKKVAPVVYGFHYEEIGMIGDGGLHAELVRNRSFEEATPPKDIAVKDGLYQGVFNPKGGSNKKVFHVDPLIGWTRTPLSYSPITIERSSDEPLNGQSQLSMQVSVNGDIEQYEQQAQIYNQGYLGMNFTKGKTYRLSFYIRSTSYSSPLTFSLTDQNGAIISKRLEFSFQKNKWLKFAGVLTAEKDAEYGMLAITPSGVGQFNIDMVSLMPTDTWDNGQSVFRKDIMQNLVDYAPDFIRFPGGCIVHGINEQTMYHWKETIGDIAQRPGAWSKWAPYYRTDGIGFHEFLELCEYTGADAMYVSSTGMVCSEFIHRDANRVFDHKPVDLDYYITDMLDAIEYALGPVESKWGARRAENGHPKPFALTYLEIGNEDFGPEYYKRYEIMFNAVREKYPNLKIIANSKIGASKEEQDKRQDLDKFVDPSHVEIFDEHYYQPYQWAIENYRKFDAYDRQGPANFIGELGLGGEYPKGILAEGIIKMGLERNGELNSMIADRPLMRNWDFIGRTNMQPLLLHNSSRSIKTFNYYLCKLFRDNKIDVFYNSSFEFNKADKTLEQGLFATAGYDTKTSQYVIKVINISNKEVDLSINIPQIGKLKIAKLTTLCAERNQINTPLTPNQVKPTQITKKMNFPATESIKANSLTIIRL